MRLLADKKDIAILAALFTIFLTGVMLRREAVEALAPRFDDLKTAWFLIGGGLWLVGALLVDAAIKCLIYKRLLPRLTGHEPPRLLVNLSTTIVFSVALGGGVAVMLDGSLSTFLTTSGALTVVVGFALKELIPDFFCGIAINLEQPFKMGDWVEVQKDVVAKVVEINWRATRLLTDSHKTIIVPNRMMANVTLVNYSLPTPIFRENMKLVLGNEHDPDRIANILMAAILSTPQVLPGKKNRVRIDGFNERGTIWALKFWVGTYSDHVPAVHNVYANSIRYLHAAGIEIPYNRSELIVSGRSLSALHETGRRRDTMTALRRVPLFNALHDQELAAIADKLRENTLPSGAILVRQGEEGQSLFVLVEGLLSVRVNGDAVGTIQPGSVFGEMSLLTGEPRKATISAHTDAVVLEIAAEQIRDVMASRPEIVDELARNQQAALCAGHSPAEEKSTSSALADRIRTFFRMFAARG